jgi:hypothetical protein
MVKRREGGMPVLDHSPDIVSETNSAMVRDVEGEFGKSR